MNRLEDVEQTLEGFDPTNAQSDILDEFAPENEAGEQISDTEETQNYALLNPNMLQLDLAEHSHSNTVVQNTRNTWLIYRLNSS